MSWWYSNKLCGESNKSKYELDNKNSLEKINISKK